MAPTQTPTKVPFQTIVPAHARETLVVKCDHRVVVTGLNLVRGFDCFQITRMNTFDGPGKVAELECVNLTDEPRAIEGSVGVRPWE